MQFTIHQMHEVTLQCSGNVRLRELVLNFGFRLWFQAKFNLNSTKTGF